jgi:hypothetical protein
MSFRYIYDARSAVALRNPELQSTVVAISVSTLLRDNYLTKLSLTGDVLHEEPVARNGGRSEALAVTNNTLKELNLYFRVISMEGLQAISNFKSLERLTIRLSPAAEFNDSSHGFFLLSLLQLANLRHLSLNFRVYSSSYAARIVEVLRDQNYTVETLHGVVLDFAADGDAHAFLREKVHFYLRLNRHGRRLRRSRAVVPWPKVLARCSDRSEDNVDVLYDSLKAVSSLIGSMPVRME